MCKHLSSEGAPNSNYYVKFHAFKEAPTAFVMCKYLFKFSKETPTTIVMLQYLAFKWAPNRNGNV